MTRLAALLFAFWAVTAPVAAQAEPPIRLDIAEARRVAAILLNDGEPGAARDLARTLLKRDPSDFDALLVLARANLQSGRLPGAVWAGRRAFDAARDPAQRFLAANVTAGALNGMGARTRAQLWLRRAAQHAPDDGLKTRTARDYAHVRAANPLSFGVHLGLRPTSNVNNGSQHDTERFGALTRVLEGSEKALSGTELTLGFDARYRLHGRARHATWVAFGADAQLYRLSGASRNIAPDASAGDFAYRRLGFGVGHSRITASGHGKTTLTFDIDHSWTGRTARNRRATAELSHTARLGSRTRAKLRGHLARDWRLDRRIDDATKWGMAAAVFHDLNGAGTLGGEVSLSRSDGNTYRTAHDTAQIALSYTLDKPVMGAQISLQASAMRRDFDLPFLFFDPRRDTRLAMGARLFFRDLDAYGFAPMLDIGYVRNRSNIDAYDGRSISVGVGLKSTF